MSPERRRQAAEAFWSDANAAGEQAEAVAAIAQRLKFRTKSLMVLPAAKKTQYLLGMPGIPDIVAARLLVTYHVAYQRPMMSAFLDAMGVLHDNGLLGDDSEMPKDPEKLRQAVAVIAASFPAEDVSLYLSTLCWQDADMSVVLAELPETKGPVVA